MLVAVDWYRQEVYPLEDVADEYCDETLEFESWLDETYTIHEIVRLWEEGKSIDDLRKEYVIYERNCLREQLEGNCAIYDIMDGQVKQVEIDEIMPRVRI